MKTVAAAEHDARSRGATARPPRGRITFQPHPDGSYTFEAPTRFDKLFSGIAAPVPAYIPVGMQGTEHISAADTFDADCARLLARAQQRHGKWMASPMPASWNQITIWLQEIDELRRVA